MAQQAENSPARHFVSSVCPGQLLDNAALPSYCCGVSLKAPARYPIRVAAHLTGLSIDTLRAWERRYQAVTPLRDDRGRIYAEDQIRRLILLRNAVDCGHAIGQVASLSDRELQKLLAGPVSDAGTPATETDSPEMSDGLLAVVAAIESFDCATASSHLSRMAALLPVREFVGAVVVPLMRLVGDRWHAGTLSVAQEHMTSSILRNLLGSMVRPGASSTRPLRILFATPAGELHEFGILVAAMLSVASGFEALYLGPNLPAQEIVDAVAQTSPRAVVLGIKCSKPGAKITEEIQAIASQLPRRTELWLGGDAAAKALAPAAKRVFVLQEFAELDQHLDRLKMGAR